MNARSYIDEPAEPPVALLVEIVGDVAENSVDIFVREAIDEDGQQHDLQPLPQSLAELVHDLPETARFWGLFPNWEAVIEARDNFVAQYHCRHRLHPLVRA